MSAVQTTSTSNDIEKKQESSKEDFLFQCEEDSTGEVIKFQLLKCKDTEVSDFDIILISITDDEKIVSGENLIFDFFVKQNKENFLQFAFLKWNDSEEWTVVSHKLDSLFFKVGFTRCKNAVIEYLEKNAWLSSDGSKQCFFNIREYNEDPGTIQKLVEGEDYVTFCPFKLISSEPTVVDGKKYFRFPGSFYKQYKKMSDLRKESLEVTLFGVNGQTYGSLFEEGDEKFDKKIHYFEIADPFTHRFLSLMRKYDFAAFNYNVEECSYAMDPSQTHPLLLRVYGHDKVFIERFFKTVSFEDDTNPFIEITRQKNNTYTTRVSVLYMEHVVSKTNPSIEISENMKKVIEMIISFGKRERFILQKIDLLEEEKDYDPSKPFYLAVENSIFQKKGSLIEKYFN